jgi:putative salt-induced outer membrane protein
MPRFTVLLAFMLLVPCTAMAQERPWDASISFGYVGTTGNTDTTTFNLEALLKYDTQRWTHNTKFQGLGAQENDVAKAERYYFENKSDFNLNSMQYLFAKGSYTDDRFSGFNYQAALSTGYGRYLLRNPTFNLQGFGGVGFRQNDIINAGNEGEVILSMGENFSWEISDSASLVQSLTSEVGDELTVTRFEIGLESNIIDRIATKISFQARNTSQVPVGNKKTDTQTSVSLVYTF